MRLLVKCLLVVLVLNVGVVFGAVSERFRTVPPLTKTLADTCDNMRCWFGVELNETPWRDAKASIENSGGYSVFYRNQKMNFHLRNSRGTGEIQFAEGLPYKFCLFPRGFNLGDVLLTFGNPEHFWIEPNPNIATYSTIRVNYYLIYQAEDLVVTGWFDWNSNPNAYLDFQIPVRQICQPDTNLLDFSDVQWMSDWRGIWYPISKYMVNPYQYGYE